MNRSETMERAEKLANEFGGTVTLRKSGHICLNIGGRKFFTGSSPSDRKAGLNFEKDVRRMLREGNRD